MPTQKTVGTASGYSPLQSQRQTKGRTLDVKKLEEVLQFFPHVGQEEVLCKMRRYTTLVCGRRWGKTKLAALIAYIALNLPNKRIWIVAPTYSLTEKVWREVEKWTYQNGKGWASVTPSLRKVTTIWGTELLCKTAENPDSLVGESVDLLIVDEAALIKDSVWDTQLSPTLLEGGIALFITTPRGRNWIYNFYNYGKSQDPENDEYISFNFPTSSNPYIKPEEIEKERRKKPQKIFEQEYLAQFIDDAGIVFRNVDGCAIGTLQEPVMEIEYVMGVDLARKEDFTVIIIARKDTREVVFFDRFNEISWRVQKPRIVTAAKRYNNATIVMDTTGIGDVVFDDIRDEELDIRRYDFTNKSKSILIEDLIIALDERRITYPPIPELISELKAYEFEQRDSGFTLYNAPPGLHDDTVVGLALCNRALTFKSASFAFL